MTASHIADERPRGPGGPAEPNMSDMLLNQNDIRSSGDPDDNTDSLEEFDEIFSGRGFTIARKGRFLLFRTARTKEEQRALMQDLADYRSELSDSIEQQVQELEELLSRYEPLDIIGNVSFANAILDPETYKEYEHEGNDAYTEYVALLYLTQPYETYSTRGLGPTPPSVLQDIQSRVKGLFSSTSFYFAIGDIDPDRTDTPDVLSELRFQVLLRSLVVRYMAYLHHQIEIITGIFEPIHDELKRALGFALEEAVAMIEGIGSLVNRRFFKRRDQSREFAQKLRKAVKRYRQRKRVTSGFTEDLLIPLASVRPSKSAQTIQNMAIAWTFYGLGETLSFTSQDLVDETGIDPSTVDSFLERMSLEFGEIEPRYRVPAPTHPLMTRPLIQIEQRYFCPVVNAVLWSLKPAIESYLNPDDPQTACTDTALWERYNRARAAYVERKAVEYLAEALRHAQAYTNLTYNVVEDGELKEAELDGLLVFDSALFLVEAKAGSLSPPARRGAPKRMVEEIRELVEDAYTQALRAKGYIQEADEPVFRLPDGTDIVVPRDSIDRFFLVTVSLESLDPFVTTAYQLQELGLFAEGDLPWAVCLADLRVISELIEFPSQLLHYLARRQRLNQLQRLHAYEELDWFGHYLSEGLFFDDLLEEPDAPGFISLSSYTTVFDDYYFYVTGQRETPVPKPVQPMPEIMRQVLVELEALHPPGYLEAACTLLNMGGETREKFAEHAARYREVTLADRAVHDFTLGFDKPSFGITYMFAPREGTSELEARLKTYCNLKKYQSKSQLWIGFGCLADEPGWVHMGLTLRKPWVYDEEMEKVVAEMLPPLKKAVMSSE